MTARGLRQLLLAALLIVAATAVGLGADPASASTTIVVNQHLDVSSPSDGVTSLREAFAQAQTDGGPTTIQLPAGATLGLTNCSADGGDLNHSIDQALTIEGNGATVQQTCSGQRVMTLATPNQIVTINDLSIAGGDLASTDGAGLWVNAPLIMNRSRLVNNHTGQNTSLGGGLRAMQGVTMSQTLFVANSAGSGGAMSVVGNASLARVVVAHNEADLVGGVQTSGTATLINSIVTGNTSSAHGTGGVAGANVLLRNTTVTGNTATAFVRRQVSSLGELNAVRSIVSDPGPDTGNCTVAGTVVSQGFNYASDNTCGFSTSSGDLPVAGPVGFDTMTTSPYGYQLSVVPPAGSPLIDAIPAGNCDAVYSSDVFLAPRPQGAGCDVGALETAPSRRCHGAVVTMDLGKGDQTTPGPDVILGTSGPDDVNGLGGADVFCGLGGNDRFRGGPGADKAFGGPGGDDLRGGGGADVLDGGKGNDRVEGGAGADQLRGRAGRDLLLGGAGDDRLAGGSQRDDCRGQGGRDRASGCEVRTGFP